MEQEFNVDKVVKGVLKRRITEKGIDNLTKEQMKKVLLSIMERQNLYHLQYSIYNMPFERHNNKAEIMKAVNILNLYRNTNYNQPTGTEENTISQMLNIILPAFEELKNKTKQLENEKNSMIEEFEEIIEMLQSDRNIKGALSLAPLTKKYSKGIEEDIQEIINKYKVDIKTKFTEEELEALKHWYESPTNEYKDLSFEEYIKSACEAGVIEDLLYN